MYFTPSLPFPTKIESLKATLEEVAPQRSSDAITNQSLAKRLSEVLAAKGPKKGKALEELMASLFASLKGLQILKRNACLQAEELDLIIKNDLTTGFWRIAGSPLIVECKNWSGKVGAREISVLVEKLQALSPDAKAGIMVALNGVSGDSYSDAMLKIREARQRGRYVLVLEYKDLEEVASGISLAQVIERKYDAIVLI
jgi:Holliday junction resolvase-like predicted endonuclease